jgi:hypothetical protein
VDKIADPQLHEIARSQFTIDGQVKERQFSNSAAQLQRIRIAQMSFRRSGAFCPTSFPLCHGLTLEPVSMRLFMVIPRGGRTGAVSSPEDQLGEKTVRHRLASWYAHLPPEHPLLSWPQRAWVPSRTRSTHSGCSRR